MEERSPGGGSRPPSHSEPLCRGIDDGVEHRRFKQATASMRLWVPSHKYALRLGSTPIQAEFWDFGWAAEEFADSAI